MSCITHDHRVQIK